MKAAVNEATLLLFPIAPMGRMNFYVAASGRLGPPAKNTAAGKNDRINCPIVLNNGQL